MADWNNPTLTSNYTDVLGNLKDRDVDAGTLFLNAPTNPITGMIRYNRSTNKFEEWNGSAWVEKLISISGGGTGANTAAGARSNLGLGSMATQNNNAVNITGGTISGLSSLGVSGTVTAGLFSGSGANLTNIPNSATTATNLNSPNTIVLRDASGNFSAGTITAALNGNAATVTNGVYTTGNYSDPTWITSLSGAKILSGINGANITTGTIDMNRLPSDVIRRVLTHSGQPLQVVNTQQANIYYSPRDNDTSTEFDITNATTDYEILNRSFNTNGSVAFGTGYATSGAPILHAITGGPNRFGLDAQGIYLIHVYITYKIINSAVMRMRLEEAPADTGSGSLVLGRSEGYAPGGTNQFIVLNCSAILYVTSTPVYLIVYVQSTAAGNKVVTFLGQRSIGISIAKLW